jgi:cell division protein FtsB
MPPARTSTAPRPRPRRAPRQTARAAPSRGSGAPRGAAAARPRRVRRRAPASPWTRIRWDRIGRTALLIVLVVVAGLYVQHAVEYFTTRSTADAQQAIVHQLARQNVALRAQARSLQEPQTIERYARSLGMVKAGERPYVILGLPSSASAMRRRGHP